MSRVTDNFSKSWTLVFAAFIGQMFGVGTLVIYSFGLFTEKLSTTFGWSLVEISLALTVFNYSVMISAIVYGKLIDRLGARRVVLVSTVAFGCVWGSFYFLTASLTHFYLLFFLAAFAGGGTLPIGHSRIIIGWFQRKRGLALGLVLAGVGIGAAVLPPTIQILLESIGWRLVYLALGVLVVVVSFPIGYLFLREATPPQQSATPARKTNTGSPSPYLQPKDLLHSPTMWVLVFFAFAAGGVLIGALSHFVPLLRSNGVPAQQAAGYASIIGISVVVGRVGIGWLIDRIFAPRVMFVVFLAPLSAFTLLQSDFLLQSGSAPLLYMAGAVGIGLSLGAEIDVLAYLVSRYFGNQHFGTLYGGLFSVFTIGAANGPLLIAYLYELNTSYQGALQILAGVTALICLSTFAMPRFPDAQAD